MSKAKTTTPINKVINNLQVSFISTTGTTQVQRHPNNFKSQSQSYQQMNQLIIQLDARYKNLTPAQQAAWTSSSIDYIGIDVCGCPRATIDGQKLQRLVNYFNTLLGALLVDYPPASILPSSPTPWIAHPTGLGGYVLEPDSPNITGRYLVIQRNRGLYNQQLDAGADGGTVFTTPGDANSLILDTLTQNVAYPICIWASNSTPCGTGTITVTP